MSSIFDTFSPQKRILQSVLFSEQEVDFCVDLACLRFHQTTAYDVIGSWCTYHVVAVILNVLPYSRDSFLLCGRNPRGTLKIARWSPLKQILRDFPLVFQYERCKTESKTKEKPHEVEMNIKFFRSVLLPIQAKIMQWVMAKPRDYKCWWKDLLENPAITSITTAHRKPF